ncbi:MAG: hypothetical protein RL088_3087 [Verrucomicrobiota bacterium]
MFIDCRSVNMTRHPMFIDCHPVNAFLHIYGEDDGSTGAMAGCLEESGHADSTGDGGLNNDR